MAESNPPNLTDLPNPVSVPSMPDMMAAITTLTQQVATLATVVTQQPFEKEPSVSHPMYTLQSLASENRELRAKVEELAKQVALLTIEVRIHKQAHTQPPAPAFMHHPEQMCDDQRRVTPGASSRVQIMRHPKKKLSVARPFIPTEASTSSNSTPKPKRRFDNFGAPMSLILDSLIMRGLISPLPPPIGPRPRLQLPERYCSYHQVFGHDTDYCGALRSRIQDLIDDEVTPKPRTSTISVNKCDVVPELSDSDSDTSLLV